MESEGDYPQRNNAVIWPTRPRRRFVRRRRQRREDQPRAQSGAADVFLCRCARRSQRVHDISNATHQVFTDDTCDPTPDRALLVGYNDHAGYWIIKNSGMSWGLDGYAALCPACAAYLAATVQYIAPVNVGQGGCVRALGGGGWRSGL